MKFKELLQMNRLEREQKLKELRLELVKLNAQVATGTPPKNVGQLKRIKKDIARLMFIKSIDEKKLLNTRKTQQETNKADNKTREDESSKRITKKPKTK